MQEPIADTDPICFLKSTIRLAVAEEQVWYPIRRICFESLAQIKHRIC